METWTNWGEGGTQIQAPSRRYFWIFFIKPIVAHTQILVHTCKGLGKGFRRHFADGLNQSVVSSVVQAVYEEKLLKYKHTVEQQANILKKGILHVLSLKILGMINKTIIIEIVLV